MMPWSSGSYLSACSRPLPNRQYVTSNQIRKAVRPSCADRARRSHPKLIVRRTTRNGQMGGYIVAAPIFLFQLDGRIARFPAICALHGNFVRSVRVDAPDSQLRRTHESAVKASSLPDLLKRPAAGCGRLWSGGRSSSWERYSGRNCSRQ
jgi:hypothetical protein